MNNKNISKTTFIQKLRLIAHYLIPQFFLTRLAGVLAESRSRFVAKPFIWLFSKFYKISLHEAEKQNLDDYETFNEFFIRKLKQDARPIVEGADELCLPADGKVSQCGQIKGDVLLQAKGHLFNLNALLAGDEYLTKKFTNGTFITTYLAPHNYHRVHMPCKGVLKRMIYVPGDLFSVNPFIAQHIPNLFARNERVICEFDTEFGPMVQILVGATITGSITTAWSGVVTPPRVENVAVFNYDTDPKYAITLEKGEVMGSFKLGSTVINLFPENTINLNEDLREGIPVKVGELLGNLTKKLTVTETKAND